MAGVFVMWGGGVGNALPGSSLQWLLYLAPSRFKGKSGLQVEDPGGGSGSSVLFSHVISIHCKQLITRDEFPETKQVVWLVSIRHVRG